jgi:hypothetical protein
MLFIFHYFILNNNNVYNVLKSAKYTHDLYLFFNLKFIYRRKITTLCWRMNNATGINRSQHERARCFGIGGRAGGSVGQMAVTD